MPDGTTVPVPRDQFLRREQGQGKTLARKLILSNKDVSIYIFTSYIFGFSYSTRFLAPLEQSAGTFVQLQHTLLFIFLFSFISLIADGPHHYHPACGH